MNTYFIVLLFSLSLADENVKFAAIIYRHGDRTPVDTYPTDPWRNESLWPVKFGELTNIGKRQHYELGRWLRQRYSHLLSDEFDPTEIYVRSTDVDRTLMSAQANLAGMYPPRGNAIWDKDLMWQPIPVHTVPEKHDEVLAMKKPCLAYTKELNKLVQSKEFKDRLSGYQSLMDYLTAYTGENIKDYTDIGEIYNILYIETLYNFTLPNWTNSVYPDKLREPACYDFSISASTPTLARLIAGPLLKDIVTKMAPQGNKSPRLKMVVYSAHDFTVGNILTALGLYDGNCPVYTSTIIFELISDNTGRSNFIRISYRNSTKIVEPYVLSIPYCGKNCPLERFKKLYENILTVDFDYDCGNHFPTVLGMSFCVGMVLLLTVYAAHKIYFTRLYQQNALAVDYMKLKKDHPKPLILT